MTIILTNFNEVMFPTIVHTVDITYEPNLTVSSPHEEGVD